MRYRREPARAALRTRIIELVDGGGTYAAVAVLTATTRNVVSGIMFRHNNPGFKSSWRKSALRKRIPYAGAEHAPL